LPFLTDFSLKSTSNPTAAGYRLLYITRFENSLAETLKKQQKVLFTFSRQNGRFLKVTSKVPNITSNYKKTYSYPQVESHCGGFQLQTSFQETRIVNHIVKSKAAAVGFNFKQKIKLHKTNPTYQVDCHRGVIQLQTSLQITKNLFIFSSRKPLRLLSTSGKFSRNTNSKPHS
jgi:hypothetical protein